jgi:hypothetical protein
LRKKRKEKKKSLSSLPRLGVRTIKTKLDSGTRKSYRKTSLALSFNIRKKSLPNKKFPWEATAL